MLYGQLMLEFNPFSPSPSDVMFLPYVDPGSVDAANRPGSNTDLTVLGVDLYYPFMGDFAWIGNYYSIEEFEDWYGPGQAL